MKTYESYGFNDFIVLLGYRKEKIIEYFGDGSRWGVEINYISEKMRKKLMK